MIDLYTAPTPEGWKVSIALEELRIPYVVHALDACSGGPLAPDFLRINPCGCVPAIVDRDADGCTVFESGAILVYLAEKTGQLMPRDAAGRARVMQWLMLNVGGAELVSGRDSSVARRELLRLFGLLDRQLQGNEYLAGSFSIADIAHWAWVRMHAWSGIDMSSCGALARWLERIASRDACIRGSLVPRPFEPAEQVYRVKSILLR